MEQRKKGVKNNWMESWKNDEEASFQGWDFSYLKRRISGGQPPWNYISIAKKLIHKAQSLLEMDTGGGEIFSKLAPFPKHTIATEGYGPNVPRAKEKLEPLGIKVLEVKASDKLPFDDHEFDLILNRHGNFNSKEIYRILDKKGYFFTQQVDGYDLRDLKDFFKCVPKPTNHTLVYIKSILEKEGFKIKEAKEWSGYVMFCDVGALVYFLKAIPWIVENFSVSSHLSYLKKLQDKLEAGEKLVFTRKRFMILVQK